MKNPQGKRQLGLSPLQSAYMKGLKPGEKIVLLFRILMNEGDHDEDKEIMTKMVDIAERISKCEYTDPVKEIVERYEMLFESGDYTINEMAAIRSAIDLINRLEEQRIAANN
jgi:hypothetical protein